MNIPSSGELLAKSDALQAGLDYLRDQARSRAPVLTGRLRDKIQTRKTSETSGDVYIWLIYAPKQERRDWQKHPHGGGAEYMHLTFALDGDECFKRMAERILGELNG